MARLIWVHPQDGGTLSQNLGNVYTGQFTIFSLQTKRRRSLLTPLLSLLAFGRSGLFGPPLCGGSAPATPPLLQHASPTWCRYS